MIDNRGNCKECKKLRRETPENKRKWRLKGDYGIDLEFYEYLFAKQQGKCAICGNPPSGKRPVLHVDHDHITGKVRALLCSGCNVGLGMFKDDPDRLLKAVAYLRLPA
jgi:Autographiviridae endonuclease VII